MDRRTSSRKSIDATAYIYYQGKRISRPCTVRNISSGGVFLELQNHGLRRGRRIELVFPIYLTRHLIKLRRISGIVIRITPKEVALIIRRQSLSSGANLEQPADVKGR